MNLPTAESIRISEDAARTKNWKRWGPYLSERQWATVREDYSPEGLCWDYLPHEHARGRAYRWGEDGLFGATLGATSALLVGRYLARNWVAGHDPRHRNVCVPRFAGR